MDAIEKRAREIYADQFPGDAGYETREWIMAGTWGDDEVIAALIAALTPPKGYVLVPVERGAMYVCPACHGVGSVTQQVHDQMLAARPEVP